MNQNKQETKHHRHKPKQTKQAQINKHKQLTDPQLLTTTTTNNKHRQQYKQTPTKGNNYAAKL